MRDYVCVCVWGFRVKALRIYNKYLDVKAVNICGPKRKNETKTMRCEKLPFRQFCHAVSQSDRSGRKTYAHTTLPRPETAGMFADVCVCVDVWGIDTA